MFLFIFWSKDNRVERAKAFGFWVSSWKTRINKIRYFWKPHCVWLFLISNSLPAYQKASSNFWSGRIKQKASMFLCRLPHVLSPQLLIKILSVGDKGSKIQRQLCTENKPKKAYFTRALAISTFLAIWSSEFKITCWAPMGHEGQTHEHKEKSTPKQEKGKRNRVLLWMHKGHS